MKFIIGVEQDPRVQFTLEVGDDGPPNLIQLPDGSYITKQGQYLSPGNKLCYRRVNDPARIPNSVVIKPWDQYTHLEG